VQLFLQPFYIFNQHDVIAKVFVSPVNSSLMLVLWNSAMMLINILSHFFVLPADTKNFYILHGGCHPHLSFIFSGLQKVVILPPKYELTSLQLLASLSKSGERPLFTCDLPQTLVFLFKK
jgi:hypothetical protein